jgi:hypothetical protein
LGQNQGFGRFRAILEIGEIAQARGGKFDREKRVNLIYGSEDLAA